MKKLITFLLLLFTLTASAQDYFVRQQISNHPILTDVTRFVVAEGVEANNRNKVLRVYYRVKYFKDSVDLTGNFNPNAPAWTVTNGYRVKVLDAFGEPIPNPDYEPNYPLIDGLNDIYAEEPDNEYEQYVMVNAFDYFWGLFNEGAPLDVLFGQYIPMDDVEHKRFN